MGAKIRVFCPSCKTILEVPASFADKNTCFSCPQCGFNAPFNSYGRLSADIFSPGAGLGHENSTFVSSNPTDATECFSDCKCEEGVLVRCNDRKAISLPMGLNSIGRESFGSSPKFKTTFIPLSNLFPLMYDAFFASVS